MESYQTDRRVGKMHVGEILERMGIIDGGWSVTFTCLQPSRDANIIDKLATPLRSSMLVIRAILPYVLESGVHRTVSR
jgi:hypothetical protein